jgi:hypothetical protein
MMTYPHITQTIECVWQKTAKCLEFIIVIYKSQCSYRHPGEGREPFVRLLGCGSIGPAFRRDDDVSEFIAAPSKLSYLH